MEIKTRPYKKSLLLFLLALGFILFLQGCKPNGVSFAKKSWKQYDLPEGLSLESPIPIATRDLSQTDEMFGYIYSSFYNCSPDLSKEFNIDVNVGVAKPEMGFSTLEGNVQGVVKGISKVGEKSGFDVAHSQITHNDMPVYLSKGSYVEGGKKTNFTIFFCGYQSHIWYVTVRYPDGDKRAKQAANRIIESIKIDKPLNP